MPETYKFQVSMSADTSLPRDAVTNTLHFQHVAGGILPTDAEAMCQAILTLWYSKYAAGGTTRVAKVTAYKLGAPPQFPIAEKSGGSIPWVTGSNREQAICLSFARNKKLPRERGRIFLCPGLRVPQLSDIAQPRPTSTSMLWALSFYSTSNDSLPDVGGPDWKFGVYSPTNNSFVQASEAWVDDEWDVVRSRGLQPTTRQTSVREG